jgi:hypothetical protein
MSTQVNNFIQMYSAVSSTVKGAHGYLADGLPLRRNSAEMRIVNW